MVVVQPINPVGFTREGLAMSGWHSRGYETRELIGNNIHCAGHVLKAYV